MATLRHLSTLGVISALVISTHSNAVPGAADTWKDWCPAPSTVSLSFTQTQYVPVTTTETDTYTTAITERETSTITLYQTIIATQVLTTTETTPTTEIVTTPTTIFETVTTVQTEIQPTTEVVTATQTETTATTELQTIVTTSPITLTATEELEIYSSTTRFTSIKLCPTRITNPTFTLQAPLPTDWTWGCPPGWLCKPKQEDCNFEVGLPDQNFYCAPNECIPADALPEPLSTWDSTPAGNSTPLTNPALTVNAIDDYFNMNPTDFGLTYQIFIIDRVVTFTSTTIIPPAAPSLGMRQAQTLIPGACYPWCNNVLLEAQSQGKTPALCRPGSAFETDLGQCLQCIHVHADDNVGNFVQIAPQFQQFINYCAQFSTTTVLTSTTKTTTTRGTILTTVVPTISTTIVPSSVPPSTIVPSSAPPSTPASPESPSPVLTTTVTLPTTLTSVAGESTYTGSQLSQITIVWSASNSTTTMAGTDLSGATVILPGSSTTVVTSSYVTTITSGGVALSSEPASSGSPTPVIISSQSPSAGASVSTFTGAASPINANYGPSWFATLLAGLVALF